MTDYKKKYKKYNNKCINLINKLFCPDFYFIHETNNFESLLSILKDGKIVIGTETNVRHYSADAQPYIFCSIYFEKIKNLSVLPNFGFILHPKIILEYNMEFRRGWGGPVKATFEKNETVDTLKNKLKIIKKLLKNPKDLTEQIHDIKIMHHEIVVHENINIMDNILEIICFDFNENQLRAQLNNTPYKNINIYTKKYPFPSLKILTG